MTESTEERWLTYAEAGEVLGISAQAARMFAKRHNWARRTPNAYGERAQVLVPIDAVVQPRAASYADRTGYVIADVQPRPNGHDQVNDQANVRAIEVLNEQLGVANRQIEAANQRADRAEQRADNERKRAELLQAQLASAQAAERTAREEAAGLRISERGAVAELAALHQQLEVTERQACALRTEQAELRKTEQTALDLAKTSAAEASEQRKKADDAMAAERIARDEAAGLRTWLDQLQGRGLWARLRNKR
jgi:hypothetical protein